MDKLAQLNAEKEEIHGKLTDIRKDCSETDGFSDEQATRWDELTDRVDEIDAEIKKAREDAERLAAFDSLQPPGNLLDAFQASRHGWQINSHHQTDGGRCQAIRDVMVADHRRANGHGFVAGMQQERLLAAMPFDDRRGNLRRLVAAKGDDWRIELR